VVAPAADRLGRPATEIAVTVAGRGDRRRRGLYPDARQGGPRGGTWRHRFGDGRRDPPRQRSLRPAVSGRISPRPAPAPRTRTPPPAPAAARRGRRPMRRGAH